MRSGGSICDRCMWDDEDGCYVTVGTFFPTWDGGPMITMLEGGSGCSVAEVAECSFYEFLCSEWKSRGAASELLMGSG